MHQIHQDSEGGKHVKPIFRISMMVIAAGLLMSTLGWAHQDASFTYKATAGMYEDVYDYFKASPAYLPGFKRNVFWGQLANLQNRTDRVFANSGVNYYLLGGEMDLGVGHVGIMYDTYGYTSSDGSQSFGESGTHSGYGETTNVTYQDRNSDNILDYRRETFGKNDFTSNYNVNDIYAAYGLGGVAGFDVGVGVRGQWSHWYPTYDSFLTEATTYKRGFKLEGRERQLDLVTGQTIYTYDESSSGSWNYGQAAWRLNLGARAENLMPNLSVVANLAPIFKFQTNELKWQYDSASNSSPANASVVANNQSTYKVTGSEIVMGNLYLPKPATGMGVAADVRGDYALSPSVLLIGKLGIETIGLSSKDVKRESAFDYRGQATVWSGAANNYVLASTVDNNLTTLALEGTSSGTTVAAQARVQFPQKGWQLALGVNANTYSVKSEDKVTSTTRNNRRYDIGDGVAANSYSRVQTSGYKATYKNDVTIDTLELPVAMVFDVLSNLKLQIGAKGVYQFTSTTNETTYTDRTLTTTVTTTDAGAVSTAITPATFTDSTRTSTYSAVQRAELSYGLNWWPYEQVQVDFTAFYRPLELSNYQLSLSIYF